MEKSFPLNDTPYLAEDLRMWFAGRSSGVLSTMDCLNISTVEGMVVRLGKGVAFLQAGTSGLGGAMYCNDGDLDFELDVADSILNRIDAIIIRYNVTSNSIKAMVLKGMPSSEPKIPTLVRNSTCYDIMLYTITVEAGYSSVEYFMINDERMNNEVCGLIRDNIERIPTEVLEATFLSWFEHMKGQLDEDAAGHLQSQIDKMITDGKEKIVSKIFETSGGSFHLVEKGFNEATMTFENNIGVPFIEMITPLGDEKLSIYKDYAFTIESNDEVLVKSPMLRTTSDIRLERMGESYFGAVSCGLNKQSEPMLALALCTVDSDFDWTNSLQVYSDRIITNKDFVCGGKLGGAAICAGSVNITPVPNVPTKVTVRFPVQVAESPIGVASASSAVPGTGITGVSVADVTRTKMDVYVTRTNNTLTLIDWIAMAS